MATRLAHVSDLHLLSHRKSSLGTRYVSLGRPLDIASRAERAWRAFSAARAAGAHHLVISGDLTEMGHAEEFEVFAEALARSGFVPEAVTLIPGNHDRYGDADAWSKALEGPLAPYRKNTADAFRDRSARLVDLGDIRLLALDVTRPQPCTRSAGFFDGAAIDALGHVLTDAAICRAPLAIIQHHPPYGRGLFMQWIDGLEGWEWEAALLEDRPNVQVLHGHIHRNEDRPLHGRALGILGTAAIVNDSAHVRLFDVTSDGLVPPIACAEPSVGFVPAVA